jgi:putative FmdB family regulatory protein
MPIYEYECLSCGRQCEVIQKFSDEPLNCCPECGGHMHKLVSQSSFILKGTGWYATGYASSGKKSAKEGEGKQDKKTEVKTESKKESTAEAVSKN